MSDLQLRPDAPAHGGSVVARNDEGKAVLVFHALPGELVEAEPRGKRGGVLFAQTTRVVEASPRRVEPGCIHFTQGCGGCQWQHAGYDYQLELKRRVVEDTWSRANLRLPPDTPVHGMDDPWRYRIRGEFEAIPSYGGGFDFGFHRLRSHSVLAIEGCPIHDLRIEQGMLAFRTAIRELSIRGVQNLLLTVEPTGKGLLWKLNMKGRTPAPGPDLASRVAELLPDQVLLDDSMSFDFWDLSFRVKNESFVQTNYRQMLVLYQVALDMLDPKAADAVLDLYSGIGTISLAIARRAGSVTSVEENPHSLRLAGLNARINGTRNVAVLPGKVEEALRKVRLGEHQAVVLDPPRAGCDPAAIGELLRLGPDRIVYISCEPPTHARDIALLVQGGYRVRRAALVDMFPHTYHIESVALLERG